MDRKLRKIILLLLSSLILIFSTNTLYGQTVGFKIFYGNLHSHTSFSDGKGTPEEAYLHASKYGDILAVTDHCYFLKIPVGGQSKIFLTQHAARNTTLDGKFVGLQGFEWTAGSGHINVYETTDFISRDEKGDLRDFYDWIIRVKKLAQFNHPGVTFGNFQDFWFVPEADKFVNLIEIGNGNSTSSDTISEEMYRNFILALNRGWHLSPTANQDNHKQNWISANDSRTGILARNLTYEDVMDALWNRRTFASEDKNVKVYMYGNESIMGSILYDATQLTLGIRYEDIKEPVQKLEVVSQSGTFEINNVVGKDAFEISQTFTVPDGYEWYFVRIIQKDGDEIVSAPIWVEAKSPVKVNYLRLGPEKPRANQDISITYDVYNTSENAVKGSLVILLNGNVVSSENLHLKSYDISYNKDIVLKNLPVGKYKVEFLFDGKNVQSLSFEVSERTGKTVLIDKLHENEFTEEFKKLVDALEKEGNTIIYSETMLVDYNDVDVIIIPGPSSDGLSFFKELMPEEIEWLNSFSKKIYILRGSDDEYFNNYLSLITNAYALNSVEELYNEFGIVKSEEFVLKLPNVVYIDQGHANDYAKDKLTMLEKYLNSIGYEVIYIQKINKLDGKYLVLMNGKDYSDEEISNILQFVRNGGTLILTSKSDYQNGGNTEDLNLILDYMNAPVRFNDDQVIDEVNNYGANYKVLANNIRFYSACSLVPYSNFEVLVTSQTAKSVDTDGKGDAMTIDKVILAGKFKYEKGTVILLGKAIFSDYDYKYNEEFVKNILFK
uniref:Phosphotransferase n=1 Tax=Fervidobacterium nodosum TaxID=2424 RepID=A0A7C5U5Z5_9BACT